MSALSDIKNQIKGHLDYLASTPVATLAEVQVDDFKTGVLERDIAAYPCAILTTPSIESISETNRDNARTYTFAVVVVQKQENISSANDVENLAEAILNRFDNDPTLAGKADAGLEPAASAPEAAVARGKGIIYFTIVLRAKKVINLTFT